MTRLADYVVDRLVQYGISRAFLVTGGGAMHLNDAFSRSPKVDVTCFHHEQSCTIAAEGYFRVSGRIPVVNVTTGPGGINALNGVFGAYTDSIPMLVISGQVKTQTLLTTSSLPMRQLGDQEANIVHLASSIVKYSHLLVDPTCVGIVLDKALYYACSGRPGPVWIDIPIDLQSAQVNPSTLARWSKNSSSYDQDLNPNTLMEAHHSTSTLLDTQAISTIYEVINRSRRPVIMAGTGVTSSNTVYLFRDLVDYLGIPVVTGWNAHDLLPYEHPLYCGRPGTVGDRPGNFTVQNSDLLIIFGCRLNIRQISYNWRAFADKAFKVLIEIDKSELYKPTLSIDLPIHGDLRQWLPALNEARDQYKRRPEHLRFLEWCKERVVKYDPVASADSRQGIINPYHFIDHLFRLLPSNTTVVAGNGSACVIGFQASKLKDGQRFFTNSGNASMGYDLPAAIGAALANPENITICLTGDGSIMMNIQELATVAHLALPIKILLIDNGGYNSILQTQVNYFPDNVFGTGHSNGLLFPDFIRLAESFGIRAISVQRPQDLDSDIYKEALASDQPCLVSVKVDSAQQFSPKLASKKLDDGTMVTPRLENMWPFLDEHELLQNTISD